MKKAFSILLICISILPAIASANPQKPHYQDSTNHALELSEPLRTPQGLDENIFQPMTSEGQSMKTLGGSEGSPAIKFDANISPVSAKSFLHIFIQPSAARDIQHLSIKLDTTMDGQYDRAYTVSDFISGLCANGYVKCNPGTWTNCSFFRWEADEDLNIYSVNVGSVPGVVGKHKVTLDQKVANCFCINNSCSGNISWQNRQNLLQTIGNGILDALMKKTSKFSVTNSVSDEFSIEYQGMKTAHNVEAASTGITEYTSGPSNPEALYESGNIQGAGEDEMQKQAQKPESPYHRSYSVMANVTHPKTTKSCFEKTSIEFSGDTPYAKRSETCSNLDLTDCDPYGITVCDYFGANCIDMIQYGKPTGFNPIPSTIDYKNWNFTANGSQILAQNYNGIEAGEMPEIITLLQGPDLWWNVQREYQCKAPDHDYTDGRQTEHDVDTTLEMQGIESFSYSNRGEFQASQLPYRASSGQNCEPVCKVRLAVAHSDVTAGGGGVWEGGNSSSHQDFYKTCIADSCPVEANETLLLDCGCHNAFAEAMSAVSIIEAMSKDIICSSD